MDKKAKQTRDPWVLEVQQWLNETYGNVAGFGSVPEDGYTGWNTIYGLIRAVQHELGITTLVDNFGATTSALWDKEVTPNLINTYESNFVKLIDGAFRCKGMGTGKFNTIYTTDNDNAIKQLKIAAGFESVNSTLDSTWAKALFDMSAFVLVPSGDATIRSMQQGLNREYWQYTGILPCDGVYQRQTNTALIYGLQAEIGMDTNTENGNYGPGTEAGTPVLNQGDIGPFVRILQYGLYVNGYNKQGDFSGNFTSYIAEQILAFRQFMVLPPYNQTSDLTVMKGLLTSNGNTNRSAEAFDTSTILTKETAEGLKSQGFSIVGRYLTGTVGTGADERDKSLSFEEIEAITQVGLAIFPIYQDGGWYESYFTQDQGLKDGKLAIEAAYNLGFPLGTTIYFACDVDIQDGNIPGTVLPYFAGVWSILSSDQTYNVGVYGTRNVCQKIIDASYATQAFVSNMSSGFSGNLGFPMPKQWAFDQFIELTTAGVGIDKVAVSGRDRGISSFSVSPEAIAKRELLKLYKNFGVAETAIEFEQEVRIEPAPNYVVYLKPHMEWSISGEEYGISVLVKDKKVDMSPYYNEITDSIVEYSEYLKGDTKSFEDVINELGPKVDNGAIAVGLATKEGLIGTRILMTFEKELKHGDHEITSKFQLEIEIYLRPLVDSPLPDPVYQDVVEQLKNGTFEWDTKLIVGVLVSTTAVVLLYAYGSAIIGAIGAIIVGITGSISTVVAALAVIGITLMGIYSHFIGA